MGAERYEAYRQRVMVPDLMAKNDAALAKLKQILPFGIQTVDDRQMAMAVLAGVCFPQDRSGEVFRPTAEFDAVAGNAGDANRFMAVNDMMEEFADIAADVADLMHGRTVIAVAPSELVDVI